VSQVKLILTESIHNLGESGDLVSVKPGYARNFLLPQNKAILATEGRVRELEHHKRIVAEKAAKDLDNLKETKKALEKLEIEIGARAGENGKLFGSVTSAQIAAKIIEQGYDIDRRRIDLKDPIKEIGEHKVPYKLHRELSAEVTVLVISDGAPAPSDELDALAPEDRGRGRDRDRRDDDHGDHDDADDGDETATEETEASADEATDTASE
jgi:large subunit ribosomal protein L9